MKQPLGEYSVPAIGCMLQMWLLGSFILNGKDSHNLVCYEHIWPSLKWLNPTVEKTLIVTAIFSQLHPTSASYLQRSLPLPFNPRAWRHLGSQVTGKHEADFPWVDDSPIYQMAYVYVVIKTAPSPSIVMGLRDPRDDHSKSLAQTVNRLQVIIFYQVSRFWKFLRWSFWKKLRLNTFRQSWRRRDNICSFEHGNSVKAPGLFSVPDLIVLLDSLVRLTYQ